MRQGRIKPLLGAVDAFLSVSISPDCSLIASGGADGAIGLWHRESGMCLRSYHGHTDDVNCLAFSLDGQTLLSGSGNLHGDNSIALWDVKTGKLIHRLKSHRDLVEDIQLMSDGKRFISGSWDRTIRTWDITTGKELQCHDVDMHRIMKIWASLDGRYIVYVGGDNILGVRDTLLQVDKKRKIEGEWIVGCCDFSWDTKLLVTSPGAEYTFDAIGAFDERDDFPEHDTYDLRLHLWLVESLTEVWKSDIHPDGIASLILSPDSRIIAAGCGDNTVKITRTSTGHELCRLGPFPRPIVSISISQDNRFLVCGCRCDVDPPDHDKLFLCELLT